MTPPRPIPVFAATPERTEALGRALAPLLEPGELVLLQGGLGAGKSALARAIVRALCEAPRMEVPSPTFAIVQPYDGVVHADLYRLADESELDELGLFEDEDAIVLVEWPERAPSLLDRPGLTIAIAIGPGGIGRDVTITGRGARETGELAEALARFGPNRDTGDDG